MARRQGKKKEKEDAEQESGSLNPSTLESALD